MNGLWTRVAAGLCTASLLVTICGTAEGGEPLGFLERLFGRKGQATQESPVGIATVPPGRQVAPASTSRGSGQVVQASLDSPQPQPASYASSHAPSEGEQAAEAGPPSAPEPTAVPDAGTGFD